MENVLQIIAKKKPDTLYFRHHTLPTVILICCLITQGGVAFGASSAPYSFTLATGRVSNKVSSLDINTSFVHNSRPGNILFLGFTKSNQFLVVISFNTMEGDGEFYSVDPKSAKVTKSLPTGSLNPSNPVLSQNGASIFAFDNVALKFRKHSRRPIVQYVRIIQSSDLKSRKVIDIGAPNDIIALSAVPGNPAQILVQAKTLMPYAGDFALINPHIELWNSETGRLIRRINSDEYLGRAYVSPNGKQIACACDAGERGYGTVRIIHSLTGKLIWKTFGTPENPNLEPTFYLPNGDLVIGDTVYKVKTNKADVLMPRQLNLRCVSGALADKNVLFFEGADGLELWNIRKKSRLHQWPEIKRVMTVFVSRDMRTLAALCSHDENDTTPIKFTFDGALEFGKLAPSLSKKW